MEPNSDTPNSALNPTPEDSTPMESNPLPSEDSAPMESTSFPTEDSVPTEPVSLPSETPKSQKSNIKPLVIVLSVLSIVIIALVIIVIVVINQNNQSAPIAEEDGDTKPISTGLPEEEVIAYYDFQDELKNLENQATSMLNEEPSNITGIHELYSNAVNDYFEKNEEVNAMYCLLDGVKIFTNANLGKEALKVYEDVDLLKFDQTSQYMLYRDVYNLAIDLNDTEKIDYYNQKLIELEPVWEQYLKSLDEASDNYEGELEELKNQP